LAPPAAGAEPVEGDGEGQLVVGADDASPPDLLDAAEEREAPGVPVVGEDGDGPGLGEGLELDDAGEDGVVGEVAGEEGLLPGDPVAGLDLHSGVEGVDGVHEAERGAVREEPDELVGVRHRHAATLFGSVRSGPDGCRGRPVGVDVTLEGWGRSH
jgi:hypothetical protein